MAEAASENITVINNNQALTVDQGTSGMIRTSTVTVRDATANLGYVLSARVSQNSMPNATVAIYSAASTICTELAPCILTTDLAPTAILEKSSANVVTAQGDTTEWTVAVTLPAATPQGNYILDIAYSEDPILPPTSLADGDNMQDATEGRCASTPMGATVNLMDSRDGKYYRVRKMVDNRCWMIDDLAYDINAAPAMGKPVYNPSAALISSPTALVQTKAQYAVASLYSTIPNNGNPIPFYHYNWCAAMGDTSTNCSATLAYAVGEPATPQTGVCPAPFRLPMVGATPSPSTPGNGSNQALAAATTTNEFAKLDIWMGGTGVGRSNPNTFANFTTDSATNPQSFFSGGDNDSYEAGIDDGGGYWWSSTATSAGGGYYLNTHRGVFVSSLSLDATSAYASTDGYAVRCVL